MRALWRRRESNPRNVFIRYLQGFLDALGLSRCEKSSKQTIGGFNRTALDRFLAGRIDIEHFE